MCRHMYMVYLAILTRDEFLGTHHYDLYFYQFSLSLSVLIPFFFTVGQ